VTLLPEEEDTSGKMNDENLQTKRTGGSKITHPATHFPGERKGTPFPGEKGRGDREDAPRIVENFKTPFVKK